MACRLAGFCEENGYVAVGSWSLQGKWRFGLVFRDGLKLWPVMDGEARIRGKMEIEITIRVGAQLTLGFKVTVLVRH